MRTKRARKIAEAIVQYRRDNSAGRGASNLYRGIPEWIWADTDKRRKYITLPVERARLRQAYQNGKWVADKLIQATKPRHRTWLGRRADRKLWSLASRSKISIRFRF